MYESRKESLLDLQNAVASIAETVSSLRAFLYAELSVHSSLKELKMNESRKEFLLDLQNAMASIAEELEHGSDCSGMNAVASLLSTAANGLWLFGSE